MAYTPNPRRDLELARKYRTKPRVAHDIGEIVGQWSKSSEFRSMKRMQTVYSVLKELFPEKMVAIIKPVQLSPKALVLEVGDSMMLSELKQYHHHRLLERLQQEGVGCTSIRYRLARRSR